MYAGGQSLWVSTNVKGATPSWSNAIGASLPTTTYISAVTVAQGNANEIWVGYDDGTLYRQTGTVAAPVWTQMGGSSLPTGRMVLSVYVAPNPTSNSETAYVTFGGYSADNVWEGSYNGSAWTWTDLTPASSGFPQVPVYSLAVNPAQSNWLYAGTDVGVFTSMNGGASWATTNDGPANVRVDQLFWFNSAPTSLQLVAATHGRGMFETTVALSSNPAPTTSGLSPTSATAGGATFTLTVNGTNFVNGGSTVQWGGAGLATTFVSATQLTAQVPATDIASAGTPSVTVVNAAPGGGTSGSQTFTVSSPVPTTSSLSPTSATAGGATFTLTVNGTNFVNGGSTVQWGGVGLATTFVSATQLTAQVPATDIASAGTPSVTVVNAAPGGGTSGSQTFTINAPSSGGGGGGGCALGPSGKVDPLFLAMVLVSIIALAMRRRQP